MAKKLPKIYQPTMGKNVNPNKDVFYSYQKQDQEETKKENASMVNKRIEKLENDQNINEKIDHLFKKGNGFSKLAEIETIHGVYQAKLAGRIKDYLITLENKIIPLSEIIDIKPLLPNEKR